MMAFKRKDYEEIRDSILFQITRGIINEKHVFELYRTKYKLDITPVREIVKVEGLMNGVRHVFKRGVDYRLVDDMIEWLADGDKPDDKTPFYVNYIVNEPSGITDINPGSVVRTIVEAISREIDYLYAQLNQVYLAGFIDTASGSALDLVVSLLGVERKPAEPATGVVTFGRNTDPGEITVSSEAHLFNGRKRYELKSFPVKSIVKIEGTLNGSTNVFEQGKDYILTEDNVEWLDEGAKPDLNTVFYVDYVAYEQIKIPVGTRVSTYARRPEDAKVFITTGECVLRKTSDGRWEADVPVRALIPGKLGNVYAGAITVMPQPLVGVEYVINREDILNGVDEESDEELRLRAKHALEVAGKATLTSLEAAVRGVEGVSAVLVEDMPDDVPGLVRIIVDGGDADEIRRVIDDVRAAGVRVEFLRPKSVYIDVNLTLIVKNGFSEQDIERSVESKIRSYVSSLSIGEDVIFNRIIEATLSVEGVYDVRDVSVTAYYESGEVIASERDNIVIDSDERATMRNVNILIKPLKRGGK